MCLRDVEDLLAARGIIVSYEAIRKWVVKFGAIYTASFRGNGLRRLIIDTLKKWSFPHVGARSGFGARSTAMVTFLIFCFNLGATLAQRNFFSASYSNNTGDRA